MIEILVIVTQSAHNIACSSGITLWQKFTYPANGLPSLSSIHVDANAAAYLQASFIIP